MKLEVQLKFKACMCDVNNTIDVSCLAGKVWRKALYFKSPIYKAAEAMDDLNTRPSQQTWQMLKVTLTMSSGFDSLEVIRNDDFL